MCQSLSPEVSEPWGVRQFLARQSFGAAGSSCRISLCVLHTRPPQNMAQLCICLLSGTRQESWSLYTSINMLTHTCGRPGGWGV